MGRNKRLLLAVWLLAVIVSLSIPGCEEFLGFFPPGGGEEGQNRPPTLEIEVTKTNLNYGEKATIFITASDPDDDTLIFNWKVVDLDSGSDATSTLRISDAFATFTAPAVITATDFRITVEADDGKGGKASKSLTISVNPIKLGKALALDKEVVSINVGGVAVVTATALKDDGTDDTLTAVSSNESVATALVSGRVITITGVAEGKATIVVISGSGLTRTVTVSVTAGKSLTLDKTAVSVVVGDTVVVNAIATKADGSNDTISVLSLDDDIAEASASGNIIGIKGKKVGSTFVVVTSGSGETATIKVTVTSPDDQKSLTLSETSVSIPAGGTKIVGITATKSDGSADTVSATSNDTRIATISLSGYTLTVNGVATGNTTVIVRSGSDLVEALSVTVYQGATLSLDKASLAVEVGKTDLINVAALKADGAGDTVTATVNPSGIATVTVSVDSKNITVVGVAAGSATIAVTSGSGLSKTASVTVYPKNEAVLTLDTSGIPSGGIASGTNIVVLVTKAVKADGSPDSVTATSDATAVAEVAVSADYKAITITGKVAGTATITVTSGSGLTKTISVTVIHGPPASIALVSGDGQSATVATTLPSPLVVIVKDASGNPVSGVSVTFTITAGGGSLSATPAITGTDGKASATLTLGTIAGTNAVTATVVGLSGSLVTFSATGSVGPLATIAVTPNPATVASGNAQQFTAVGKDAYNNTVSITPAWSVAGGIGTVDANGLFTAVTVGTGSVVATSGNKSASAAVTVAAGVAKSIAMVSGDGQSGTVGAVLAPFVVIAKDVNGNPVGGVSVGFAITSGNGSLSATSAMTGADGKASTTLTLGTTAGTNTVTATSTGLAGSPVTFNATGAAGPLATITVAPSPVTLTSGLTQQLAAVGKDAYGNTVPITPAWSVTGGIGTVNSSGLFTAETAGAGTVVATSGSISGSASVTVSVGSVSPTNSTVVASPTSVPAGGVSTSTVTVTLKDGSNNPVSGHTVTISSGAYPTTIAPSSGTTGANGQISFTVKSTQDGVATITATDTTANVVITNTVSITFKDVTPPANVANFTATAGNGQVGLNWTNPTDSDFAGVRIVRKVGSAPASTADGTVVYSSTGVSYTDTGLTNGTTYYYRAYAYDEVPNYASGAQASATPSGPTGDITWATKTPMPTAREGLAVGVVNSKIYAIGGYNGSYFTTVEEYDPAVNTWTTKVSMPTGRGYLAVGVVNNKIYAVGGLNGSSLTAVEEYDPATNTWTTKASMPTARHGLAIGVVNNKIYAIGGYYNGNLTTVEEYDPATNTWATKASMPTGRNSLAVGVANNKIYVIGGNNPSGNLTTVEEYDPATNTWTTKASMPTSRCCLAVGVVNNKIYAIGGQNVGSCGNYCNTVEEYDPATNTWATKQSMPTSRAYLAVGVVNNKIYAIGGWWSGGYFDTVEEGTISGSLPAWNNPPTANAGADRSATVGVSESFTGSGSDYEGDSLSYAWDFDYQGGVFTTDATGQSVSYTYTTAGTYTVVLQVTDSKGAWNRDSLVVTVNPATGAFAKAYGGIGNDYPNSVQQTSDGGFIIAGQTFSFGAGSDDFLIIKLDSSGSIVWKKTFGGSSSDSGISVRQTSDGGFIVGGKTDSFSAGLSDFLLLRLDSSGNVVWKKTFGGSSYDSGYSVRQTSDGGFIVGGYTESFGAGSGDSLLLRLDSSGNIVWKKTFGGSNIEGAPSVQETSDGGFVVGGYTRSFGAGDYDLLLLKLDSSGNIVWKKSIGGSNADSLSAQPTSDGGFIVWGSIYPFGAGDYELAVLKLDSSGSIVWQKTFGGSGEESAYSVQETSDGGFIVGGSTLSFGAGGWDTLFLKLDSSGNIVWKKTFGGSGHDRAHYIQKTSDGGFIATGYTSSFGTGSYDFLLLKLDSSGNIPGCSYLQNLSGGTETTPALSESSSFTVSTSTPSADVANVSGGTETDPAITVTNICQ